MRTKTKPRPDATRPRPKILASRPRWSRGLNIAVRTCYCHSKDVIFRTTPMVTTGFVTKVDQVSSRHTPCVAKWRWLLVLQAVTVGPSHMNWQALP